MEGNNYNQPQFDAAPDPNFIGHPNFMNTTLEISSHGPGLGFASVPHQERVFGLAINTFYAFRPAEYGSETPPTIFHHPDDGVLLEHHAFDGIGHELADVNGVDAPDFSDITGTSVLTVHLTRYS